MIWLVVLTFVMSPHQQHINVRCPDRACVEKLIDDARSSHFLSRLRAFGPGNAAGISSVSHQSAFPADIDLVFN